MMDTEAGRAGLNTLCDQYVVGIWGHTSKYSDEKTNFDRIIKDTTVSFLNTDLPRTFLPGKVSR